MPRKKKLSHIPTFYCTCGHDDSFHADGFGGYGSCGFDDGDLGVRCTCCEFCLDNLLYLEEMNRLNGLEHLND